MQSHSIPRTLHCPRSPLTLQAGHHISVYPTSSSAVHRNKSNPICHNCIRKTDPHARSPARAITLLAAKRYLRCRSAVGHRPHRWERCVRLGLVAVARAGELQRHTRSAELLAKHRMLVLTKTDGISQYRPSPVGATDFRNETFDPFSDPADIRQQSPLCFTCVSITSSFRSRPVSRCGQRRLVPAHKFE